MNYKNIRKQALLKVRGLTGAAIVMGEMEVPDEKYMADLDVAKVDAVLSVVKAATPRRSNIRSQTGA